MHYDETPVQLGSLDPSFQPYALHIVNALRDLGVPAIIISGRRSASQNAEVGGAERSRHLAGRAFDLQVMGFTRDQVPFWWWQSLGEYWESLGGRWGGRFSAPDVNHFDDGLVSG